MGIKKPHVKSVFSAIAKLDMSMKEREISSSFPEDSHGNEQVPSHPSASGQTGPRPRQAPDTQGDEILTREFASSRDLAESYKAWREPIPRVQLPDGVKACMLEGLGIITANHVLAETSPLFQSLNFRLDEEVDSCRALVTLLNGEAAGDPEVIAETLKAVARITERPGEKDDQENRRQLGALGACAFISRILFHWFSHTEVVKAALLTVRYLAREKDNNVELGSSGACEGVMKAVGTLSLEPGVLLSGLCALVNLSFESKQNIRRLRSCGALKPVVDCLKAISKDRARQCLAIRAAANLASEEECSRELGELGICQALLDTLSAYSEDIEVNNYGFWCMSHLASNQDNRRILLEAGAVKHVLMLVSTFSSVRDIAVSGLKAIASLAAGNGNGMDCAVTLKASDCKTLLSSLNCFSTVVEVSEHGSSAIANLALADRETRLNLCNEGACRTVARCLRTFSEDARVAANALWAISELLEENPGNVRASFDQKRVFQDVLKVSLDGPNITLSKHHVMVRFVSIAE